MSLSQVDRLLAEAERYESSGQMQTASLFLQSALEAERVVIYNRVHPRTFTVRRQNGASIYR